MIPYCMSWMRVVIKTRGDETGIIIYSCRDLSVLRIEPKWIMVDDVECT